MSTTLWLPKRLRPARKLTKVVFYFNWTTQHIMVGFPEEFPCPLPGYTKIVCQNAAEVDKWDKKMRDQERRIEEMTDEQRAQFEQPIRDYARKQLIHQMLTARNDLNREFCRQALKNMDEWDEQQKKKKKESFQHICGFEEGH